MLAHGSRSGIQWFNAVESPNPTDSRTNTRGCTRMKTQPVVWHRAMSRGPMLLCPLLTVYPALSRSGAGTSAPSGRGGHVANAGPIRLARRKPTQSCTAQQVDHIRTGETRHVQDNRDNAARRPPPDIGETHAHLSERPRAQAPSRPSGGVGVWGCAFEATWSTVEASLIRLIRLREAHPIHVRTGYFRLKLCPWTRLDSRT